LDILIYVKQYLSDLENALEKNGIFLWKSILYLRILTFDNKRKITPVVLLSSYQNSYEVHETGIYQ
jgi:hypothetical protein